MSLCKIVGLNILSLTPTTILSAFISPLLVSIDLLSSAVQYPRRVEVAREASS